MGSWMYYDRSRGEIWIVDINAKAVATSMVFKAIKQAEPIKGGCGGE